MEKCVLCGQINAEGAEICSRCQGKELESVEVCPKCEIPKEDNSDFCSNCGHMYAPKKIFGSSKLTPCPNCSVDIPALSVFCPVCGKSVGFSGGNTRTVKKLMCPVCSKPNDDGSEYCSYCFFDLSHTEPKEMQAVMDTKRTGGSSVVQCMLVHENGAEAQLVCPKCDALNPLDEKYCLKCGQALKVEASAQYCPSCGAENPSDAMFCTNCQHSFARKGKI